MSAGTLFKSSREAANLGFCEAARQLQISEPHLYRIESGKGRPSARLVIVMASVYGCPQDLLLKAIGIPPTQLAGRAPLPSAGEEVAS